MAAKDISCNLNLITGDAVSALRLLKEKLDAADCIIDARAIDAIDEWLHSMMKIESTALNGLRSAVDGLRSIVDMPHVKSPDFRARNMHACVGAHGCPPCRAKQALRRLEEA